MPPVHAYDWILICCCVFILSEVAGLVQLEVSGAEELLLLIQQGLRVRQALAAKAVLTKYAS